MELLGEGLGMVIIDGFRGALFKARPVAKAEPAAPAATPAPGGDTYVSSVAAPALDAGSRQDFDQLSAKDQQAFKTVWSKASSTDRERLTRLLGQGALQKLDTCQGSLIGNLAALTAISVPAQAPYKASDLLTQVLADLDDPQNIHQSNRNTCAATTVEFVLATTQSAEYVRLATGLLGAGSVALQGGGTLKRVPDSLGGDDSGRTDVQRQMQSALMDQGFHWRGSYSNTHDHYRTADGPDGIAKTLLTPFGKLMDGVVPKLKADVGIGETSVTNLYARVLGQKSHTVGDLPGSDFLDPRRDRGAVLDAVAAAVAKGKSVPVDIIVKDLADAPGQQSEHILDTSKVGYADAMRSHQVLVTAITGDTVTYRNPWGYETHMSLAEFKSRLTDGVIPE
jgi:hypothetical protein